MKSNVKVVFAYNKSGDVIIRGNFDGEIIDLLNNENEFITLQDIHDEKLEVKVPMAVVGSLRVVQTVPQYLWTLREQHGDLVNNANVELKPVNVFQADHGKIFLDLVFNTKTIKDWTAFECFDHTNNVIYTQLMAQNNMGYFTQGKYTINECPIKDKFVNIFDEHFLEKLYSSYDKEKTPDFKEYLKAYIIGHGITPIEFVLGISYHIFILPEDIEKFYVDLIAEFVDETIKALDDTNEKQEESSTEDVESTVEEKTTQDVYEENSTESTEKE